MHSLNVYHALHDTFFTAVSYTHLNYDGTAVDDYLHITLTDEQDGPDALARLRVIYPNLMRLDYEMCIRDRSDGGSTQL